MLKTVFKNSIIFFSLGCLIYIIGKLLSGGFYYESINDFLVDFTVYQCYTFVLGFSNAYFFDYLEKKQWQTKGTIKRVVIGLFGATVITLLGLLSLRILENMLYNDVSLESFIASETWESYAFGFWITMTIVVIFYVVYFYNRYQKNKIKEQQVIAGTASAKFDALKNQLDPHFLFNSLNVLTSLIEENPLNAQKFTTSLSKVYRYVLEQKNKELVTVDEELAFAKTYMSLLKMRFEDSIIFEMPEKATNPESKVVPLSLQLVLENAVKHNMVTTRKPLQITIYEDGGYLVVMNNLQPKQIVKKSSGVGLENIKQRYKLLSNKKVIINQRATDFAVALPMLTKQVSMLRTSQLSQQKLDENYMKARKRIEELKAFYGSLFSYCIVIPFLIVIWYIFTPQTIQWFCFPMFGWGLGLAAQAYKVFFNNAAFGAHWEERKIKEFMQKEDRHNS